MVVFFWIYVGVSVLWSVFMFIVCSYLYGLMKNVSERNTELNEKIAEVYGHLTAMGDFSNACAEAFDNVKVALETLDERTKPLDSAVDGAQEIINSADNE